MNKGVLYGVGVGPGDPELMTLKAVRAIRENGVIAVPGRDPERSLAYRIAVRAVPEAADKILLPLEMPMINDRGRIEESHRAAVGKILDHLRQGRNVVFLTLGDPAIYSTFPYLASSVREAGFRSEMISGVPSYCAAAAALDISLTEWDEPMHVIPVLYGTDSLQDLRGTVVLMKAGKQLRENGLQLEAAGKTVLAVENCGLPDEKRFSGAEELPENTGYFTLMIAKEASS
ncbi:MAG: precorrin-2 C(20)-methyltransferase [Mogibacterium sp.]|nr:precorrin-2 C(20)-methyltransferase [Mogibacterium sp.]